MFSIGDTVYSKDLEQEGVVERIDGEFITVRFIDMPVSIGVLKEHLILISKTTSQRELNATFNKNMSSRLFSLDCDYDKIFSESSISLSKFVDKLNRYRNKWTKEISFAWVSNLLLKNGYLEVDATGTKVPTKKGELNGINRKMFYINRTQARYGNFFDLCGQEMLLKLIMDNLE